jgi:hypothetical protein
MKERISVALSLVLVLAAALACGEPRPPRRPKVMMTPPQAMVHCEHGAWTSCYQSTVGPVCITKCY